MHIGVKIGPKNWKEVLEVTNAKYCEVWFRLDWYEKFAEIFAYLDKKKINFGLHFWAVLPDELEPNLSFPRRKISEQSGLLVRQTIDIAHKIGAAYVNIHPGSQRLKKLYLDQDKMVILPKEEVSLPEANESLLKHSKELDEYAKSKDILFLVETIIINEAEYWRYPKGRIKVQEAKNMPSESLVMLAKEGICVTNDFGHTFASIDSNDPKELTDHLFAVTKILAPQTRLIHLNTVAPPFNGTDSHNGILDKDFAQGALPTRNELIQLLTIFKDRDDVWVIPEPEIPDMIDNYFAIKQLMASNDLLSPNYGR